MLDRETSGRRLDVLSVPLWKQYSCIYVIYNNDYTIDGDYAVYIAACVEIAINKIHRIHICKLFIGDSAYISTDNEFIVLYGNASFDLFNCFPMINSTKRLNAFLIRRITAIMIINLFY